MSYLSSTKLKAVLAGLLVIVILATQILTYLELQNMRESLNEIQGELGGANNKIEDLESRITSLTEKMEKVATIDDLRSIYLELSELRAHLSGLEERNSRLREAVE
ncbi:MAG: hypothetical protein QW065_00865, partial [Acidilobaceae archaeon]